MAKSITDKKSKIISFLEEAYASRTNNLKRSIELAEKALMMSREIGHKAFIGKSLNHLALFYMIMGEYSRSMSLSEEAITCFEELKIKSGIADAKYNIASIYYKTDNHHLGLVYMMDCLSIYQKYNDYHNQARVQKSIGTIYGYFGDDQNAVKAYEDSIAASIKAGDLNLESNAYNPLSGIYLKQNNIKKAEEIIETSIQLKKQTGDIRGLAFALYGRGKVNQHKGLYKEAEKDFFDALAIHQEMSERLGEAMTYNKMGALYTEMGLMIKAKDALEKGLLISKDYNIVITLLKCSYQLYIICKKENDPVKSLQYLERYLSLREVVTSTQNLKVIENYGLITRMRLLEKNTKLQKKKADELIKSNNERYELATKATKDVIWDWDIVENKIYRSANYGLVFGYEPKEDNIYLESWVNHLHPEDRSRILENVNKKINDPESNLWEDEYRYYRNDGELAYVMDRGYIIRDSDRKAIRIVGAMMDITTQKAGEKEREKMTNDIILRNKNLEQFTYIISHNLRAPVANIIGFSELVKNDHISETDRNQFINAISVSAQTLDNVVYDLNQILQVKSEMSETKNNVLLSDLVKDIQLSIKNIIEKEHVKILTDFSEISELYTIKSYLYSIFYNLITNSIKYHRPGIEPRIEIKSLRREGKIELTFKDNGMGIDLEKRSTQIFGLYKRFHPSIEGRGFGLFMTKTQVETLGGSISVASIVNEGTEFKIEFDN